ncbi:MAG: hypothetical protein JO026_00330 [Patescibacteria group bacterium]|nr:hypothetical protein [Patescibacteria group bacterium]
MITLQRERVHEEQPRIVQAAKQIWEQRVLVLGNGKVGKALVRLLSENNIDIVAIIKSDGVYRQRGEGKIEKINDLSQWPIYALQAHATFNALPTEGEGEIESTYVEPILNLREPVITAAKGLVAARWDLVEKNADLLSITATVGAPTRMLKEMFNLKGEYDREGKVMQEIVGILNGTTNLVCDLASRGVPVKEAVRYAVKRGFAETDNGTPRKTLEDEFDDWKRKAAIVANASGMLQKKVKPEDIMLAVPESDDELEKCLATKRCVVRITREGIEAGFIEDTNAPWLPRGPHNLLRVDGKVIARGPGAGAELTAGVMFEDFTDRFPGVATEWYR